MLHTESGQQSASSGLASGCGAVSILLDTACQGRLAGEPNALKRRKRLFMVLAEAIRTRLRTRTKLIACVVE